MGTKLWVTSDATFYLARKSLRIHLKPKNHLSFQIPTILGHHEVFLEELRKRLETWELRQTIGDVFLDVVRANKIIASVNRNDNRGVFDRLDYELCFVVNATRVIVFAEESSQTRS